MDWAEVQDINRFFLRSSLNWCGQNFQVPNGPKLPIIRVGNHSEKKKKKKKKSGESRPRQRQIFGFIILKSNYLGNMDLILWLLILSSVFIRDVNALILLRFDISWNFQFLNKWKKKTLHLQNLNGEKHSHIGSGWKNSAEIVLERETTYKHKQRRNYTDSKNN